MRSGFAELNGRNDQLAEFVDGLTKGVDALTRRVEEIAEQLSDLQATTAFGFDHMTAAVANQTARVDTLTVEVRVKLARYDERIRKIEAKK
jgi:methyl-accepting chemotaxis protein